MTKHIPPNPADHPDYAYDSALLNSLLDLSRKGRPAPIRAFPSANVLTLPGDSARHRYVEACMLVYREHLAKLTVPNHLTALQIIEAVDGPLTFRLNADIRGGPEWWVTNKGELGHSWRLPDPEHVQVGWVTLLFGGDQSILYYASDVPLIAARALLPNAGEYPGLLHQMMTGPATRQHALVTEMRSRLWREDSYTATLAAETLRHYGLLKGDPRRLAFKVVHAVGKSAESEGAPLNTLSGRSDSGHKPQPTPAPLPEGDAVDYMEDRAWQDRLSAAPRTSDAAIARLNEWHASVMARMTPAESRALQRAEAARSAGLDQKAWCAANGIGYAGQIKAHERASQKMDDALAELRRA